MKKLRVRFQAEFEAIIEVEEGADQQDIEDAIADIEIPENNQCRYVPDSFTPEDPEEIDEKRRDRVWRLRK